ncbi:LysR family transcriptional regulator [Herminiimonas glaciei]|uniref:LysR family transcriptional regulator n=1 Tax=Herminiimonas glaciei TaxID=523788 RepID=A0ABW2I8M2_9BURK
MATISLDSIRMFLAVAEARSFTAAAQALEVTPTAVSKAIRLMETNHGVALFQRTTRSVALTEAGVTLYERLSVAAGQIDEAFSLMNEYRARPMGTLRVTAPRALGAIVLKRLVATLRKKYPELRLDLSLNDGIVDLVKDGFDAGIRLGHALEQDMVAVQISSDLQWSVVASPAYLSEAGTPQKPRDLLTHQTIQYRFVSSGTVPPWRFTLDGEELLLQTERSLVVNDTTTIADFARQGLGLAYLPDIEIKDDLKEGNLKRVLTKYVPPTPGLFLYFPQRSQSQLKLRALIEEATALKQ